MLLVPACWPRRECGLRPSAKPWRRVARTPAPRRVSGHTALQNFPPLIDRQRDLSGSDRFLAREDRAEGTSTELAPLRPQRTSKRVSPKAESLNDYPR